jgi:5-methylcytosine-specific restriction enzyme subunit McrC
MSRDLLTLREGAPPTEVRLSRAVADALAASEVATVGWTGDPDVGSVAAAGRVGAVSVGDLQVVVEPKIDIERLVFLLGYERNPSYWRDRPVRMDVAAWFPETLAETFRRFATKALEQGLLKGYVQVDETTAVLRGRIREANQIRRRFGRSIPLEVRYDEFTVDIPENQVLLTAVHLLLRMPAVARTTRHGLHRPALQLADVSPLPRGAVRSAWRPSRLNVRYQPALYLAEAILDGSSFEQWIGDLRVSGFLLNMATIFEDFVCVALREQLLRRGGTSHLQYPTHLDVADAVPMRPDFVRSLDGRPRLVVDAKYKAEKPAGFPQADLYQLLAYCTVLGLPDGHLVYAKGEEKPRVHEVAGTAVNIHCHTVDLSLSPSELLDQVGHRLASMLDVVPRMLRAAAPGLEGLATGPSQNNPS